MEGEKGRVCVTGAGGFIGSWVVKLLLSKGYIVHGTVREPDDEKNDHLKKLEKATENLHLFKADLLDYDSLCSAIEGCSGVFHVASPVLGSVTNPEEAYKWYYLAKTTAESEALEYSKKNNLEVVTVCPSWVIGPLLQSSVNPSIEFLIMFLQGKFETVENRDCVFVDVRDVAEALLLVFEKLEASGRYICGAHTFRYRNLFDKLEGMYPNYKYPKNFTEGGKEMKLSSEKLKKLGWTYRPVEETLVDTIECIKEAGLLNKD